MKKFISLFVCITIFVSSFSVISYGVNTTETVSPLEKFADKLVELINTYDNTSSNTNTIFSGSQSSKSTIYNKSTNRLIVKATGTIDEYNAVAHIKGYNNLHILQYSDNNAMERALYFYNSCENVIYAQEDCINKTDSNISEATSTSNIENPMQEYSDLHGFTGLRKKLVKDNISYSNEVTVAVVDTGVDSDHEFLSDKVEPTGFDSINGLSCDDDNGHGTHVAGIVAANTIDNVKIKPYKVLNSEGKGTDSQIILGIEAAIEDGVDIINLSLGRRGESEAMAEVIKRANDAGIIVVAAAGNDGVSLDYIPYTPASCENVITVYSCDTTLSGRFSYSNYGSDCETGAIGYAVNSTYLNNTYTKLTGTSMSAPFVTACISYLKLDNPTITFSQAVDIIDKFEYNGNLCAEYILTDDILQLSAPIFSVESCEFSKEFYLELTCDETDATIYYQLSTMPQEMWATYKEPLKIKYDTTITAYTAKRGAKSSEKVTATYTRNFPTDDDMYEITEDGVITEYLGPNSEDDTELIVPDKIKGITPTTIGPKVFYEFAFLENIILPDTITTLDTNSFACCNDLKYVTGKGVTTIGSNAFSSSGKFLEFVGSNITEIGTSAFSYCTNLRFVDIRNLTKIPSGAFRNANVTQSLISDKITQIDGQAFCGTNIRVVDLPELTSLDSDVFSDCIDLENVSIPKITEIKNYCFAACNSLKDIYAPLVTRVGAFAFASCTSLEEVNFPLLKRTDWSAFKGCTLINTFDFPLLTYIGENAFQNCTALESFNSSSVTTLGKYAFSGCSSLKSLDCSLITTLGINAFCNCSSLEELEFKSTLAIPKNSFSDEFTAKKIIFNNPTKALNLPENVPIALPSSLTNISYNDPENVIIYGTKGSYAEDWADENDQTFIEITPQSAILNDIEPYCQSYNQSLYFDIIGFNRTYQWYGNSVKSNTGGVPIDGATTCIFNPASEEKTYNYYYCVATSRDGENDTIYITSGVSTFIRANIKPADDNTHINFTQLTVFTSNLLTKNITDIIEFGSDDYYITIPSHISDNYQHFGTGSAFIIYTNGKPDATFNIVVYGDIDGDSTCDVLDCALVSLHVNAKTELDNIQLLAADIDSSGNVDINDYQSIINMALA